MSLNRELTNSGHIHRFIVTSDMNGWEVREQEDSKLLKRVRREDWHRVERDTQLFEMTAVVKFRPRRPRRDPHGRVIEPARVWLFAEEDPRPSPTPADASLPVPAAWLREELGRHRAHAARECRRGADALPQRILGGIGQPVVYSSVTPTSDLTTT